jgi:hypothetical protein
MVRWLLTALSFGGAFLLFTVELLAANLLTPHFGGGAVTWLTALMLFQIVLFFGYAYAHFLAPRLGVFHVAVVVLCGLALPIVVPSTTAGLHPVLGVTWALSRAVILPFFALSTTSVVTQLWWARSESTSGEPYGLYAASSIGSFAALLAYPLLFETLLARSSQQWLWGVGYAVFAILLGVAWWMARPDKSLDASPEAESSGPWSQALYWAALAALPSAFLLAVTNLISAEVGSFPLLWTMPLMAYLISFIIVFGKAFSMNRVSGWWLEAIALAFLAPYAVFLGDWGQIGAAVLALFVLSTVSHQLLYQRRPAAAGLTRYYLWISAGGALGGVCGNLLPPLLLPGPFEYPILLVLFASLFAVLEGGPVWDWLAKVSIWKGGTRLVVWILCTVAFAIYMPVYLGDVASQRSFYGSYRVTAWTLHGRPVRTLLHGNTRHGFVFLDDDPPIPASYYYLGGGIAQAHEAARSNKAEGQLDMGLIGLGAGAMATYVREGDSMRVYELDPVIVSLARTYFPYLSVSPEPIHIEVGDGLLGLRVTDESFDVLTIDAFSGDAVPFYLLTLEAIRTYLEHVRPDGLLVVHVSNRLFDFPPILGRAADALEMEAVWHPKSLDDPNDPYGFKNSVVVIARRPELLAPLRAQGWVILPGDGGTLWTDDYLNILGSLVVVRRAMGWVDAHSGTSGTRAD